LRPTTTSPASDPRLPATGGDPAAIVLRGVSKSFGRSGSAEVVPALADVSLEVGRDRFVSLVGPSGCGKTTVLRLIDGLVTPDTGEVLVDGRPPRPGPHMGFVFQSFRLIPWATVAGNIAFGLELNGFPEALRRERTAHYLELVGLSRFATAYPSELSGGMKQRVALARALATDPDILLMDEPFASIDAQTRELMQFELMRIWSKRRGVVVFVTHSVDEAVLLSDRVLLMGPGPGRILDSFEVPLPRPRWDYDVRARPEFIELRNALWHRIRDMVVSDPNSAFFRRSVGGKE
jgi:NitT/TauT family transport system ATP-binding protein